MTLLIGGRRRQGGGAMLTSRSPIDGHTVWEGTTAAPADVHEAVSAARNAYDVWRRVPIDDRIAVIQRFVDAVESSAENLASIISREMGKPLWDARTEVAAVAAKLGHSVRAHHERSGVRTNDLGGTISTTRHRGIGVMAVFGPYNFPAHLPNGHIIPALLAGNAVVFKPSELTPAVGEAMIRLWDDAGLPPGTLNLVQGGRDTGAALVEADIDGLLFTGSVPTGRLLHRLLAGRPEVLLALEMGGNNPLIVLEDADPETAAGLGLQSAFITSGQRCTCARRLLVPRGRHGDEVIEALCSAAASARIGDPLDESAPPFLGPVVSHGAARTVLDGWQSLIGLGARPLLDMRQRTDDLGPAYLTPGIVDVTGIDAPDEEYFGPLLSVVRYQSVDEAVEIANRTRFGLAAGVIGGDRDRYEAIFENLAAGIINWNRPTTGASSGAPFGGIKESGNHRPAAYYASDYSSFPIASLESDVLAPPAPLPGL